MEARMFHFEGWESDEIWWFLTQVAVGGTLFVLAFMYYAIRFFESVESETIKRFYFDTIEAPKDVKILEEPSIKAPGSTAIQCYAPATGQFLGFINPITPEGIDRTIEKARVAQEKWARTTFKQRRQVLRSMQAYIMDNQEDLCRIACLDSGKTMVDATLGEILVTVEKLKWTIKHGEKALQPSKRPTNLLMMYKKNKVVYEPLGVVAALVSWNYPLHNLLGPIISAIFSGNGIVVKVSEHTAWSMPHFVNIARGALTVNGHDPNLIQSFVTWPQTAGYLTSHPGISHITFIGSQPVAKLVAASAAKSLTPVLAELGGKDAAIVLDSAKSDLPRIIEILLRGTFQAAGQNCIGIERIIATPYVYDDIVKALEPRVKAIRVGSILDSKDGKIDMGAMISDASFDRLEKLVEAAVKDGARLLAGGQRYNHPVHHSGHYFQPTLLVDVTIEMAIANEECFGPICVVMKAKNAEEATAIANYPDFGLGASVFGNTGAQMDAVVGHLKTGMVAINDFAAYYAVQLPFGGNRGSGYGRFAGEEGLRGLCNIKAICEDRWGWLGASTAIPKQIQYPIPDTKKGYEFTRAVVEIGYSVSWKGMIGGVKRIIKNS
ncbi:probable betaine aldehyde dehydrogenase [Phialocephala subalpina]|uniref:aldehyde dehydrogenase (NAD(+)) n=1 Tax=Phialocephala subalpina TaxID=576137 RepID=A0A1L7WFI9_9HELO|nr:probable betaine aldehyde dehydrogenase [Phialocephala subalpina]